MPFLFAVLPAWTSSRVRLVVVFVALAAALACAACSAALLAADFVSSSLEEMTIREDLTSLKLFLMEGTSTVGTRRL